MNADGFKSSRSLARREHVRDCVERAKALSPAGIVVCHAPSYRLLAGPLRDAGLPLLHETALPFPSGNYRHEFVEKMRAAMALPSDVA
ncbi:hypothetical protein [Cryobacterium tagatosivorans]|uniref:Uncharacterized protein n=1 Tax=Cryobacterium tagatosivorans TaxID=1259199 RepID=A0A4R8UAN0_9MICO|nr:hypothetical protein [Cryobacterium tagatosivorans]TFB47275.1 hypothetical protein E3O23_15575 [Cryobacterium tagatosivorans]